MSPLTVLPVSCAQGIAKYGTDVALARSLHKQYEALGGDRLIWLYTCRIRLHGRIRDIETCIELYEEVRRRGLDTDAWFYRAMIIACGQVMFHAEQYTTDCDWFAGIAVLFTTTSSCCSAVSTDCHLAASERHPSAVHVPYGTRVTIGCETEAVRGLRRPSRSRTSCRRSTRRRRLRRCRS